MMKKKYLVFSSNYYYWLKIFIPIILLFFGGIIYILFRPVEPEFFGWINSVGLENSLTVARQNTLFLSPSLPKWMIYSLPNGLWALSYSLFITSIWWKSKSLIKYFWIGSIPVLILGFELLQYPGIIQGTFCLQDITSGVVGILLGIMIGIKITKLKNYEKDMV